MSLGRLHEFLTYMFTTPITKEGEIVDTYVEPNVIILSPTQHLNREVEIPK